jgi:hypothetical protein
VHTVWSDFRDGNPEIYYKRSTDAGVSWASDTRLTNSSGGSHSPSVTVSGQTVHVSWEDERDGNYEIYYKRSTDAGVSWQADTRLTNNSAGSYSASTSVSGQVVHLVWEDIRDGNYEIYYKRSTDGGVSWGADIRLTNSTAVSDYPSVGVSGQFVHIAWYDDRDGNNEIYYKRSTDGGISWGADTRVTNDTAQSYGPSVSVSGQTLHIVWYDFRAGNNEIYYKRSTDGGVSWEADTRLTNSSGVSFLPSVALSGSVVHVVWCDERDGNLEIYYKRDPTGNPIGIINNNSEIPKVFLLWQNYPNPFNPTTVIYYSVPKSAFVTIKIYDTLGREVKTLISKQHNTGNYTETFDGSGLASGIYYYTMAADGYKQTRKMILMK